METFGALFGHGRPFGHSPLQRCVQFPQSLFGPFLCGNVAGNVDGAGHLAGLVEQRRGRDQEIAAQPLLMNFGGVFAAVGQGASMRARIQRAVRAMDAPEALQTDALLRLDVQSTRHRTVDPHDAVLAVQNGDPIRHGVEGPFPILFSPVDFGGSIGHALFQRSVDLLERGLRGLVGPAEFRGLFGYAMPQLGVETPQRIFGLLARSNVAAEYVEIVVRRAAANCNGIHLVARLQVELVASDDGRQHRIPKRRGRLLSLAPT